MKRIKLIKRIREHPMGETLFVDDVMANAWIERGVAINWEYGNGQEKEEEKRQQTPPQKQKHEVSQGKKQVRKPKGRRRGSKNKEVLSHGR